MDPVYQAPSNSQSVNPYSYAMNNSLSLVDPSGYTAAPTATPDQNAMASNGGAGVSAVEQVTLGDNDKIAVMPNGQLIATLADGTQIDVTSMAGTTSTGGTQGVTNSSIGWMNTFSGGGSGSSPTSATTGSGTTSGGGATVPSGDNVSGQVATAPAKQAGATQTTCDAKLPEDKNAALLSKMVFAEATRSNDISLADSNTELAAIAYSAVNRAFDLQDPNSGVSPAFYGATSPTLTGVINSTQYGSVGGDNFKLAANPGLISTSDRVGRYSCALLKRSISIAVGALNGSVKDPYEAKGGTYGMRTTGSGDPGGSFTKLPAIRGSRNTFYTLSDDAP